MRVGRQDGELWFCAGRVGRIVVDFAALAGSTPGEGVATTYRGATSLLVVAVAVSSAAWNISTGTQAGGVPLKWLAVLIALLPHVAAVAAVLVLRASAWWRRAAGLCGGLHGVGVGGTRADRAVATQFETGEVAWSVATSSLALATAALAVLALRRVPEEGEDSVPGPSKWMAVVAGLLLVASSLFAWSGTEHAPAGR